MNHWIRKSHRLLSLAFTLVVSFVTLNVLFVEEPAEWVFLLPLPILAFLWLSGIYLYVLPFFTKRRRARVEATTSPAD